MSESYWNCVCLILAHGYYTLIDSDDFAIVAKHRWRMAITGGGTGCDVRRNTAGNKSILLHRFLLNPPSPMVVDHKNHDPLDNRRANLRICTTAENARNSHKKSSLLTRFRGVRRLRGTSAFSAHISFNNKIFYLGRYDTAEQAAHAYNLAATKYHGDFAVLNQLGESSIAAREINPGARPVSSTNYIPPPRKRKSSLPGHGQRAFAMIKGSYWNAVCLFLPDGFITLIDSADFDIVSRHCWHIKESRGNSSPRVCRSTSGKKTLFLHRVLLNANKGVLVDHKNGNALDNRRENLRLATNHQNNCNQAKRSGTTSQYKGVHLSNNRTKYRAYVRENGTIKHLGVFDSEIEAALAYNAAALALYGEFARLNVILSSYQEIVA